MKVTSAPINTTREAWSAVCERRGIRQPEQANVQHFLRNLDAEDQTALKRAIGQCLSGAETPEEMSIVSWAGACTRAEWTQKAAAMCPGCTATDLFAAGLILIPQGWDMFARIHHLHTSPDDIAKLLDVLATFRSAQTLPENGTEPEPVGALIQPEEDTAEEAASHAFDLFQSHVQTPAAADQTAMTGHPVYSPPNHVDANYPHPAEQAEFDDARVGQPSGSRLKVRLFGKDAGHSLEITRHRRAGDFMNVGVVTVDSARAQSNGSYDWRNKLVIQLTPEEMPAAIAVLMGLIPSAKFENHGSDRSKFLEMRNQEGGMMLVTGHRQTFYAAPVKTANLYYVLDLFCRAMADGTPNRSAIEVTTLVRSIYS